MGGGRKESRGGGSGGGRGEERTEGRERGEGWECLYRESRST